VPPVILTILVDADKGITELRSFDKAVQGTTKSTQQAGQAQKEVTQHSTSFGASLAQSAKSAAGLAAGFAGVAGIATTLSAAATAATGFEAALNAIAALGTVSTGQLSKLREQLLALPPALGSSTELAKGLYDILGANVPAENAITVLTRSAELAKGGLGNLDTAINAVTKSAAAFGIPLSEAQYVTDVFTQTVVKGQGRLEEFAQAFPQVAATAAATGATFIDTNAAIAVLTQTFKNADTAATGLNSFFQQLIQNSAKFAAEGINVKQVLAEEGLTGIFRRLNEVTGGSAERLKELINDSEGFRAALTLTGTQFETFNETVASYANVTGLAQQAASKNLSGATASWHTFINTLDRRVQEVAPPLLEAFTSITRAATTLAADVVKLYRAFAQSEVLRSLTADFQQFFQLIGQSDAFKTLNENLLTTTGSAGDTYNAFVILDELLKGNVRPSIDFVTAGWDLLNAAFDYTVAGVIKLGQYLVDGLVTPLTQVAAALEKGLAAFGLADSRFAGLAQASQQLSADLAKASATFQSMADDFVLGTNRLGTAQEGAKKTVTATTQAVQAQSAALPKQGQAANAAAKETAQLSEEQKKLNKALEDANNAASGLKATLEKLKPGDVIKAIPADELELAVANVITKLEEMEATGKFSARQISQAYEDAAEVLRARFGELPDLFQIIYDDLKARARTTADGIDQAFKNLGIQTQDTLQKLATDALADFQAIEKAGTATPEALLDAWLDVVDKVDKGAFKTLPEGFQASSARMQEIARKLGVELPKLITNKFGDIEVASKQTADAFGASFEKAFAAVTEASIKYGNNLRDHLSPEIIDLAERMGLLAKRTEEVEKNTRGLSETAIMLGHYINKLGEEVNAYGNAIAKTTEQTQRLLDLRIDVKTPFATEMEGLQRQLQQANADLLALGRRIPELGYEGYKQQQKVLLDLIAELEKRIAALRQTATTTTTTRPTGTTTTTTPVSPVTMTPTASGRPGAGGTTTTTTTLPVSTTQRTEGSTTYQMIIQTQATDAATLARDLVPYLRQSDLSPRRFGG
jgi:TP901 family phage tail tape measure protein